MAGMTNASPRTIPWILGFALLLASQAGARHVRGLQVEHVRDLTADAVSPFMYGEPLSRALPGLKATRGAFSLVVNGHKLGDGDGDPCERVARMASMTPQVSGLFVVSRERP